MRPIAAITTLIALAGCLLAAQRLQSALAMPDEQPSVPESVEMAEVAPTAEPPRPPHRWAPVFGYPQPPAPPAAPEPASPIAVAEPPRPPAPPIESLGYSLKGLVRSDTAVWALVSHPTGERIMRVGDSLADGIVITQIDEDGVWLDTGGDSLALLGFSKQ